MPPSHRRLSELQSLVGEGATAELLLHFLRLHSSDVSRAADGYFAWRESHPDQDWPKEDDEEEEEEEEEEPPAKPSPKRGKRGGGAWPARSPVVTAAAASPKSKRGGGRAVGASAAAASAAVSPRVQPITPVPSSSPRSPAPTASVTSVTPASPARSSRGRRGAAAVRGSAAAEASPPSTARNGAEKTPMALDGAPLPEETKQLEADVEMVVAETPIETASDLPAPFSSSPPARTEPPPPAKPMMPEAVSGRKRKHKGTSVASDSTSIASKEDVAKRSKLATELPSSSIGILSASPLTSPIVGILPSLSTVFSPSTALADAITSPAPTAAVASPSLRAVMAAQPGSPSILRSPVVSGMSPSVSSPSSTSMGRSRRGAAKHTTLPLPLPMPFEQTPPNDAMDDGEASAEFSSGANLSNAFASAAGSMDETSFAPASSSAAAAAALATASPGKRPKASSTLLPLSGFGSGVKVRGFGDAKPFKPPTRTMRSQPDSTTSSSSASSTLSSSTGHSASAAASDSSSSLSSSQHELSCSPPSQQFVEQKVRNRGKYSSLDALINGLEGDVAKGGTSVEPDVMIEAVQEAVGGFATAQQAAAAASSASAATPAASHPSKPLPRLRFASNAHLQQFVLSLLQEQCCVPTTASSIVALLSSEYEVAEAAVQTQLDKLVQAGKLAAKHLDLHVSERATLYGESDDPRQVDVMWLQPMELTAEPLVEPSTEAAATPVAAPTPAAATAAKSPAAGPPATPVKSPLLSAHPSPAVATPSRSPKLSALPPSTPSDTPSSSAASTSALPPPSTPVSASNHLAKGTSSALKARLSKSRGRPSLLTVGSVTAPPAAPAPAPVETPTKGTTVPSGATPWTVLAAAALAPPPVSPGESAASSPSGSSLTEEQRLVIAARKEAAVSKRKSLLTPLLKPAPEASVSSVGRLAAQLRLRQASVAKLRAQKFIQVDEANTRETEALTEKWTLTAQEVLTELLSKVQQSRVVSMDALLRDLQVDPKQVRWNEVAGDFE